MTAGSRQIRRYDSLIGHDTSQGQASHHGAPTGVPELGSVAQRSLARRRSITAARSSSMNVADGASLRAMKTRSQPFKTVSRGIASLSLRFILFRITAFPTLLPTVKPNRVNSNSFGRTTSTSKSLDQLLPDRRTAAKSFPKVRCCAFCIGRGLWTARQILRPSVCGAP